MVVALLAGFVALIAAAVLVGIDLNERHRPGGYQRAELRFGRDVTPEAVIAVLERIAGLHRFACVSLEVRADHTGIHHYLGADQATVDVLKSSLRAHLPSVQLEHVPTASPMDSVQAGGSIRLRGRLGTLRTEAPEALSSGLLAAMQPLGERERIVMRWLIRSGRPLILPKAGDGQAVETEERRRLRLKNESSVVLAYGVITVGADHPRRAVHLMARVTSVLRTRNSAYGQLRALPRPRFWLVSLLGRRNFTLGDRYSSSELAGVLAWPLGAPALPGLQLGTSPRRIPSPAVPSTGRVLGRATWPGTDRSVAQPLLGALSHSLIAGPTGVGKSTLLTNLIIGDMTAGRGLVLIDGKGDTAAAALDRVPIARQGDVIVMDCASEGAQPGLKLFGGSDAELAGDVVLGVLRDLYRSEWGPLSERYLRAGLVAVAHDADGTLADVPYVYVDDAYRRRLVPRVRDPLTQATLAAFESMGPAERQQQLAAPLNKLGQLLGRPIVRTVLGQSNPRLDFREVLRTNKVVIISLAPARVGAPAARLIGALTIFALFQAVQGRARLPGPARRPFMVFVDEPGVLGDLPMPLDALLEQARGLGVGVTMAPQSLKQLSLSVREAALTNVATRVVFRQDADDARLLARDLPGVTPEDLGDLAAYEALARIGLGPGDLASPVSLLTKPIPKPTSDGQALARSSAVRDGQTVAEVDTAIRARHEPVATGPVGRKRRAR